MKELRFHKGLYPSSAIEAARLVYEPFASIEQSEETDYVVLQLCCRDTAFEESDLAGEFANYVLGAAVDGLKPAGLSS